MLVGNRETSHRLTAFLNNVLTRFVVRKLHLWFEVLIIEYELSRLGCCGMSLGSHPCWIYTWFISGLRFSWLQPKP